MINRNKDLILQRVILLFIYKILYIKIINLFFSSFRKEKKKVTEKFEQIPLILKEPLFEKAFHTSEIGAMTREDYNIPRKFGLLLGVKSMPVDRNNDYARMPDINFALLDNMKNSKKEK